MHEHTNRIRQPDRIIAEPRKSVVVPVYRS